MRSLTAVIAVSVAATGCFVPRSAGFGQTGAMLSPNEMETSLQPGMAYQVNNTPVSSSVGSGQTVTATTTTGGVTLPVFEGNAAVGLTETVGLNIHLSPAGIQPGVKVGLLKGPVNVAILPQVGFGFWTTGTSTTSGSTTSSSDPSSFVGFLGGFKAVASHEMGAYAGFGYDMQIFTANNTSLAFLGSSGRGGITSSSTTSHNISVAAGYELKLGSVRVRPELAFIVSPSVTSSSTDGSTTVSQGGGSMVYVFPNVTFAAATPRPMMGSSSSSSSESAPIQQP